MRTSLALVVVVVVAILAGPARADAPPTEKQAGEVASRWLDALHAGDVGFAALVTPTAEVHGAPCKVHDAVGRAAIAKALPEWRYCMPFKRQKWKTVATGPDWREIETREDGESLGDIRVRVGRGGAIRSVSIDWTWGGV